MARTTHGSKTGAAKPAREPKKARSRFARAKKPAVLESFNPATGAKLGTVPASSPAEVKDAVARARKVSPEWASIPPKGRARLLSRVRHRIYERMDDIVETVAMECGKPRAEALAHDVVPTVLTLMYYERAIGKLLRPEKLGLVPTLVFANKGQIEFRPFGVVGCITPWNYPFFLSFMALAPSLFAGNTVVIKPSEVTPQVGELLRDVLEPLPAGVANVVQGDGEAGAALVEAACDKIVFIGSPDTGRKVAEAAAKSLTPVVMELGGKDAAVVLDDVDVDIVTSGILWGSFLNAGQACCAIERVYVHDAIYDRFAHALTAKLGRVRTGQEDGDVGALTFEPQLQTVRRQVKDAVDKGATVLAGGSDDGGNGNGALWFQPTVLEGTTPEMEIFTEETFGPVLGLFRVRDDEEAIRRVNEESFNLTASVWGKSRTRAERIAGRLRAGSVAVNDHATNPGNPWGAWGGVGESGYGRLNGAFGIREMTVPVFIGRSLIPNTKRLWWYPYDEASTIALRAVAEAISAPKMPDKLKAAGRLLGNAHKALKNKI